jgi:hypothetical protein
MESVPPAIDGAFRQFGDRTSSFVSLYPEFESFEAGEAIQRYVAQGDHWFAAAEPFARDELRADAAESFREAARRDRKRMVQLPVSRALAEECVARGFHAFPVGQEPIFELAWLSDAQDRRSRMQESARRLIRRGYRIQELSPEALTPEIREKVQAICSSWLARKGAPPLGFLNRVDPLRYGALKKYFFLLDGPITPARGVAERMQAFAVAVPIFKDGRARAYFFSEYMRIDKAKPGVTELLLSEAMGCLAAQGVEEARLGICPLAGITRESFIGRSRFNGVYALALQAAHRYLKFPIDLRSIHEFKSRVAPTRWETLYGVTDRRPGLAMALDLMRLHLGGSIRSRFKPLLQKALHSEARIRLLPASLSELLSRTRLTLGLGALFALLHLARAWSDAAQGVFAASGYRPALVDAWGVFVGPLFHTTHYHFLGDLSTFVLFAGAYEAFKGSRLALAVIALGLWASNPVSHALVSAFRESLPAALYARFMTEEDYGSSNAVYAAVGALAALIAKPRVLLLPFVLNGLFLCFALGSLLSVHHLVGLALGYWASRLTRGSRA